MDCLEDNNRFIPKTYLNIDYHKHIIFYMLSNIFHVFSSFL